MSICIGDEGSPLATPGMPVAEDPVEETWSDASDLSSSAMVGVGDSVRLADGLLARIEAIRLIT